MTEIPKMTEAKYNILLQNKELQAEKNKEDLEAKLLSDTEPEESDTEIFTCTDDKNNTVYCVKDIFYILGFNC